MRPSWGNMADKENIIQKKSYDFALNIINLVKHFPKTTEGYVISNQLIRSGTSVGANVEEAIAAFSKEDFAYKMNIALKEARESNYWLRIIRDSQIISNSNENQLITDSEEIIRILTSIVKTSQKSHS